MDSGLPVTAAASVTRNLLRAADFAFRLRFCDRQPAGAGGLQRLGDLARRRWCARCREPCRRRAWPTCRRSSCASAAREDQRDHRARGPRAGLTPQRLDELASLAAPVSGDAGRRGPDVTRRVRASRNGRSAAMMTPLLLSSSTTPSGRSWKAARHVSSSTLLQSRAAAGVGGRVALLYRRACEHLCAGARARLPRLSRRHAGASHCRRASTDLSPARSRRRKTAALIATEFPAAVRHTRKLRPPGCHVSSCCP